MKVQHSGEWWAKTHPDILKYLSINVLKKESKLHQPGIPA